MGDLEEPSLYSTITVESDTFVLSKADADALMDILRRAELYQTAGWGDARMHYIGGYRTPDVQQGIISKEMVLRGRLAGPKPAKAEDD